LEKVPTKIIPNGGCYNYEMVICHGRSPKTRTKKNKSKDQKRFSIKKITKTQNQQIQGSYTFFSSKKTSWIQKMPIFSEEKPMRSETNSAGLWLELRH